MRSDPPHLELNLRSYLAPIACAVGTLAFGMLLATAPRPVHASSKQAQAAGAAVFHDKGCQHCHGEDATGTDRGPDLSSIGKRFHRDRIEQQIRNGGGGMPAFGDLLQPDEVKALVDFLSAKRKPSRKAQKLPNPVSPPVAPKSPNDDSGA